MPKSSNTQRSPGAEGLRSCLTADEVLDFAAGRFDAAALDAIHAHIDRCGACQRLAGEALRARSSDVDLTADPEHWNTTFRSGDVVGHRYRVLRFIARGGMGEVYEAYDRDLEERVALKTVISTACDGHRAVRRLKAEVQLAHRVSHPNVCRIYDLGSHKLGNPGGLLNFLTMEFVEGERLAERIARAPLPVSDAEPIVRSLLLGLEAAHAAGILHRDLKCDNVMLRPTAAGEPVPVIMDFGLARAIEIDAARVTSSAYALAGTPCYMAPEQLEGSELSTATDVYAFGVMWFEMLTGRLPFSTRAPFERLTKSPPRPSSWSNDVPASIDKIIIRCLERLPERRFQSATDVLDALDALERREPVPRVSGIRKRGASSAIAPLAAGVALVAALLVLRSSAVHSAVAAAARRTLVGSNGPTVSARASAVALGPLQPADNPSTRRAVAAPLKVASDVVAPAAPVAKTVIDRTTRAAGTGLVAKNRRSSSSVASSTVAPPMQPQPSSGVVENTTSSATQRDRTTIGPQTPNAPPPATSRPSPEALGLTNPFK